MKKSLLFILVAFLLGCSEMMDKKATLISGQIFHPASGIVVFDMGKDSDTAILDSTGRFTISLNLEGPSHIILAHGREITHMFLHPGDDIFLTLDTEAFDETVNYSGEGALPSNYLASMFLLNEQMNQDPREAFKLPEEEFMMFMKKSQYVLQQHLDTFFFEQDPRYHDFVDLERNRIKYEMATEMLMYPAYYKYLTKDTAYTPSEGYYAFLDELDLDNGEMMVLDEYQHLLQMYVSEMSRKKVQDNPEFSEKYEDPYSFAYMLMIINDFRNETVKNYLMKEFVLEMVNYRGLDREDTILSIFYANCNDSAVIHKVEEEIRKWERIARGKPAPGFNYPDINGNMVALEDMAGKYVYIDVWATWCGPCKTEIPYLKELSKEFRDRNVVFVSVSVDDSREDWEAMVREKELSGLQLFGGAGWKSTITEDYNIRGIPRFILIDREGTIIDATAPRPSGNIRDVLLALEGI